MKLQIKEFKNQMIQNNNMEISLFLSAGIFGSSLMHTPIATILKRIIMWSAQGSVLLAFLFIVIFVTLMAFLGIHQIISIPLILPFLLTPEINITVYT